jgi:hypothetical protein
MMGKQEEKEEKKRGQARLTARVDGKAQRDGVVLLPKRNGIAGQTSVAGHDLERDQ